MNATAEARWYTATVTRRHDKLGLGFGVGATVYCKATPEGGVRAYIIPFAIRNLTREEARTCLRLTGRLDEAASAEVERRFDWDINR